MATEAGADIAYYEVEIKPEPVDVEQHTDYDAEVKEDDAREAYAGGGVMEEAAQQFYTDHIKQEMDIGPMMLPFIPSDTDASKEYTSINTLWDSEACSSSTSAVTSKSEDISFHVHVSKQSYAGDSSPQCDGLEGDLTTKSDKQITGQKLFGCTICETQFTRKSELTQHKQIHTKKKPFCCAVCGEMFNYKSDLIRHEIIHSGEKPFSCKICGKQFSRKQHLTYHEPVHTREKLFQCKMCEKRFTQKSALNKHEKSHTTGNLFCCDICKQQFPHKTDVSRHRVACSLTNMTNGLFVRFY